jgi:hypothetical protein
MTVVHTYFYTVVDTQRGCHTLKKYEHVLNSERLSRDNYLDLQVHEHC